MPQNELILRKTLAGIEGTRGTAATVTRKVYDQVSLVDTREPLDWEENAGSYDAWRTFVHGPVTVTGTAEGPVSFEDQAWWNQLGIKGGVAGVSDGAVTNPAYTYTHTPSTATDDLAAATMQTGVPDNVYVSEMVMVPEWTIAGDVDGDAAWRFSARLLAQNKTNLAAGYTAGVADRNREFVKAAGTKLFIDAPGAIGTTQVLGRFISFSVTWNNAILPKRFMEDETEVSARVGRGARQVTGQVRIEFDNDAEYANYRNATARAIRIEREGTIIHDAVRKLVRIDISNAYWLTPADDAREQNLTKTFGFRGYVNATVAFPGQMVVRNALAALA